MKKFIFLISALFINSSFAGQTTNHFSSNVSLAASCSISADTFDFGDLTAITSPSTISKTLSLNVLCTRNSSFSVLLDSGSNHDASNNRFMKAQNSSDVIQYGICKTSSFSTSPYYCGSPWWGTTYTYTATGTGKPQVISGYIFSRTGFYKPNNYSDTVVTTILF